MKKVKNVKVSCYVCGASSDEAYLERVKGEKDKYICEYCGEDNYSSADEDGDLADDFGSKKHPRNSFFDDDIEQDAYFYE